MWCCHNHHKASHLQCSSKGLLTTLPRFCCFGHFLVICFLHHCFGLFLCTMCPLCLKKDWILPFYYPASCLLLICSGQPDMVFITNELHTHCEFWDTLWDTCWHHMGNSTGSCGTGGPTCCWVFKESLENIPLVAIIVVMPNATVSNENSQTIKHYVLVYRLLTLLFRG